MVAIRLLLLFLICSVSFAKPLMFGIGSALPKGTPDYVLNDLNSYISEKMGRDIIPVIEQDHNTMNSMIENRDVDFASVCTTAMSPKMRIIAIPEINGRHSYLSFIIVNKNSGISTIKEIKGRSFAFTDRLTGSGSVYPAYLMIKEFGQMPEQLLKKVYYTQSNEQSVYLVNKGVVDAAAVDGGIFLTLMKKEPEKTAGVRVIHKSPEIIAPPFVASKSMPDHVYNRLRRVLINMHKDNEGKKILSLLNINRFVPAKQKDYETLYKIRETVENFSSSVRLKQ